MKKTTLKFNLNKENKSPVPCSPVYFVLGERWLPQPHLSGKEHHRKKPLIKNVRPKDAQKCFLPKYRIKKYFLNCRIFFLINLISSIFPTAVVKIVLIRSLLFSLRNTLSCFPSLLSLDYVLFVITMSYWPRTANTQDRQIWLFLLG